MNTNRMMKTIALTAILTVSAISLAQQSGPRGGGQGGPQGGRQGGPGMGRGQQMPPALFILHMSTVQKELGITAAQDKAIDELTLKQGRRGGPGGPGGQGGPGGPPPFDRENDGVFAQQGGRGQGQQGQGGRGGPGGPGGPGKIEGLDKILNERQLARHKQLTMQWDAPMIFMRPEVAEDLNISENQRGEIDEIIRKFMPPMGGPGGPGGQGGRGGGQGGRGGQGRPPMQGGFGDNDVFAQQGGQGGRGQGQQGQGGQRGPGGQGGPGANFNEMLTKKKQAMAEVWTILTDGQKRSWSTMVGNKFDNWVQPELPRPQGGQGGPPPAGF